MTTYPLQRFHELVVPRRTGTQTNRNAGDLPAVLLKSPLITADGTRLTERGEAVADAIEHMEGQLLEVTMRTMGDAELVRACTDLTDSQVNAEAYFTAVREANHAVATALRNNSEFHRDAFSRFDASNGEMELQFDTEDDAAQFIDAMPERNASVRYKHDKRYSDNQNPKRVVVTVDD